MSYAGRWWIIPSGRSIEALRRSSGTRVWHRGSSFHLQFAVQNLEDFSPSTIEKPQALVLDPEREGLQIDRNERSGVGYRLVHG